MDLVMVMASVALLLSLFFVVGFIWVVRSGQYDDLETPAYRILNKENQEMERLKNAKEVL